jgi:hypothetical protein
MASEIQTALWNDEVASERYEGARASYQTAILEQYKLYVWRGSPGMTPASAARRAGRT